MTFPSSLDFASEYNLSQFLSGPAGGLGQTITLRNVSVLAGANPFPNPPIYAGLVVNGNNPQNSASINLRATNANGRFVKGDTLALGADPTVYTVTADTNSTGNLFNAVPITPNLAQQRLDGDAAVPTFLNDITAQALVTSFPARLVNGTSIQMTDKQIRFLASAISFTPSTTDKVFIGGDQYSIITVKPISVQGKVYAYSCHLRR